MWPDRCGVYHWSALAHLTLLSPLIIIPWPADVHRLGTFSFWKPVLKTVLRGTGRDDVSRRSENFLLYLYFLPVRLWQPRCLDFQTESAADKFLILWCGTVGSPFRTKKVETPWNEHQQQAYFTSTALQVWKDCDCLRLVFHFGSTCLYIMIYNKQSCYTVKTKSLNFQIRWLEFLFTSRLWNFKILSLWIFQKVTYF